MQITPQYSIQNVDIHICAYMCTLINLEHKFVLFDHLYVLYASTDKCYSYILYVNSLYSNRSGNRKIRYERFCYFFAFVVVRT